MDTIAAIATPPGQGAIAVLRVSGPDSLSLVTSLFRSAPLEPRQQTYGRFVNPDGELVDEGLVTYFPSPRSYTGEDLVEISCHGGILVTRTILQLLLRGGARAAEAGEFTQRAFLNEKLDLTQAEAVMDLISAQTGLAQKTALAQLQGRLGQEVEAMRQELIRVLAHLEAYIDFPEEEIDPETGAGLMRRLEVLRHRVDELSATAEQGRILREGVRTVICGEPNAGKSSLLNLLTGFDRAIVTEQAGTTRDTIEETINLDGIPLHLIDTAGLRHSLDPIEKEGMARSNQEIEQAELILEIIDGHLPPNPTAPEVRAATGAVHLPILNKADLGLHRDWESRWPGAPRLSCTSGEGLQPLKDRIVEELCHDSHPHAGLGITVNTRHVGALQNCAAHLRDASSALERDLAPELVAVDLRSALHDLGDIVGKTDIEEILGEIFRSFCIGK